MKKMFYSEVLDKYFEDEKDCRKAELQYQLDKQEKEKAALAAENERKEALAAASKEKKELSKAVEEAETKLSEAYNNYELKQEEVKKLYEDYKKAADNLLQPAKTAIKEAQQARYNAIAAYNKKYGTYSVVYTGDKAFNEFKRTSNFIDRLFNEFWF